MRDGVLNVPPNFVRLDVAKKHQKNNSNGSQGNQILDPAREPHPLTLKLAIGVVGTATVIILGLIGIIYYQLNQTLTVHSDNLKEIGRTLTDQEKLTVRLEEKINSLEKLSSGAYKSQAKAAGFTDPHILPISFNTNTTYQASTTNQRLNYSVTFSNIRYEKETKILFANVDGQIGTSVLRNSRIVITLKPGEVKDLMKDVHFGPATPAVFIQVLDVVTPDQAVFAVGTKETAKNSPS